MSRYPTTSIGICSSPSVGQEATARITNHFRSRLSDPTAMLFGVFSVLTDPAVAELVAAAGFDFVGLEMEHGAHTIAGLEHFHRAAQAVGIGTIVKLPASDGHQLLKVLETGIDAVLLAAAPDAAAALVAVESCRFPPDGTRGISTIVRGASYSSAGMNPEELTRRNRDLVVGVLVESPTVARSAELLAAHDGVDFVFVGTADLALSMGVGHQATASDLKATIDQVVASCTTAGKTLGMPMGHPAYPMTSADLSRVNARVVIATSDVACLLAGLRAVAKQTHG